jgi:hypothetical protein
MQDTIGGATNANVRIGYGHAGRGQMSQELYGSGKKERSGLSGIGVDQGNPVRGRGLDFDGSQGHEGQERS